MDHTGFFTLIADLLFIAFTVLGIKRTIEKADQAAQERERSANELLEQISRKLSNLDGGQPGHIYSHIALLEQISAKLSDINNAIELQ